MRAYLYSWGALFFACCMASMLGLNALAMGIFPIPVALYWVRKQRMRSYGLLLCAGCAALVAFGLSSAVGYHILVAALGVVMGAGIVLHWPYGRIVAAVTAGAFALLLANTLHYWEQWCYQAQTTLNALAAEVAKQPNADDGPGAIWIQQLEWLSEHWEHVSVGMMFWPVLIGVCIGVTVVSRLLDTQQVELKIRGTFRGMRTTEWLVWVAIVVACTCYADWKWPNEILRVVAWNAAIMLSAIYWLNGVAILLYGRQMLRPPRITVILTVLMLAMLGVYPILCFVGLFDTWGNYRGVIDRITAAREQARQDNNDTLDE